MVMAVILLLALALLLGCYCAIHRQKISAIYLKPLLKNTPLEDYYYATPIEEKRRRGIWDIPGPQRIPFLGTKWIFLIFFRRYKMTKLHEVYAGDKFSEYQRAHANIFPFSLALTDYRSESTVWRYCTGGNALECAHCASV